MYTSYQAHSELLVTATQSCRKPEQSEVLCPRRENPKIRGGLKTVCNLSASEGAGPLAQAEVKLLSGCRLH